MTPEELDDIRFMLNSSALVIPSTFAKELLAEVDRLRGHSVTLNAVAFRLAQALGDVPEGQEWAEGDPVELADRLIAERDQARAALERAQPVLDAGRAWWASRGDATEDSVDALFVAVDAYVSTSKAVGEGE